MKLSILVPVYNEEKTIKKLLSKLNRLKIPAFSHEIIVIDDHSSDFTPDILAKIPKKMNLRIVNHQINQGKGAAIRTGMKFATGNYLIVQDADFEYDPADIKRLLSVALSNPGTVVYGSRYLGKHIDTPFHKIGNFLITVITNLLFQSNLTDMETCYKLIPKKIYRSLDIRSKRFNFEPEVTAKILRAGNRIIEVPINYHKRGFYEGKKLRWWKDGFSAVWTLVRYRFP